MIIFYFLTVSWEIFIVVLTFMDSNDQYSTLIVLSWREFFEILNFSYILWAFRPRKEWPEFYGLGVDQFLYRFEPGNRAG